MRSWLSREPTPADQLAPRAARFATIEDVEARKFGSRALDALVARLTDDVTSVRGDSDALPYPLAVLEHLLATHRHEVLRLKTGVDSVEIAVRFAVAIAFGLATLRNRPARVAKALRIVPSRDKDLTFGQWFATGKAIAELVPSGAWHPAADCVRRVFLSSVKKPAVEASIASVVTLRNRWVGHSPPAMSEDACREEASLVERVVREILASFAPLAKLELVSVNAIDRFESADVVYNVRCLRGPSEHFPFATASTTARLSREWCYLLGAEPVSLAPFFLARTCEECRRTELMVATRPVLGPPGAEVPMQGLLSHHRTRARVPPHEDLAAVYRALEGGA